MQQDQLIRATALDGKVRAFAVRSTSVVEEIRRRHDTFPTATAALGRTVTAGLMMGAMLQDEQKLTIQIKGNGPLGQIVVDANAKGEVRGYVENPFVYLPSNALGKLDVAGAVGRDGFVNIVKDLGLREPYRGSIPIVSGELAEDFTYYFASSEQTPSVVGLGVLVDTDNSVIHAGGYIVQLMPGFSDHDISFIEERLKDLDSVTNMLSDDVSLEAMLEKIVGPIHFGEATEVKFDCNCSAEKVERMLISLGPIEVREILREDKGAEVSCHFCNEKYQFGELDLRRILHEMEKK